MCFGCLTGTCPHGRPGREAACYALAGGMVPAVTAFGGTALCAAAAARNLG